MKPPSFTGHMLTVNGGMVMYSMAVNARHKSRIAALRRCGSRTYHIMIRASH